jgi:hypothetical protein
MVLNNNVVKTKQLGVSLRDPVRNEDFRKRSIVTATSIIITVARIEVRHFHQILLKASSSLLSGAQAFLMD